ncbi:PREDICTED: mitochondrial import inner membrane translocase subunit Tim21 [Ceratosolen solmsi marchali]|uniref:Mitochondrial import inner membrane translocase subunit Tim21 n=1 Tax=Ceratosolen solmsi marchali TaxID=326594 RepID=A0AAJ7E2X0_9HYME|nr:PREDICTED: mitochondrial import inner membrane translocase subunit Tim21 [Ceratosolen solmsi marchali]
MLMAMSRALTNIIRQRHLFPYTMPMISSKAIVYFPFSTSSHLMYLSKKSLTKSNKSESGNQLQVDYIEVVKKKTSLAWHLSIFVIGLSSTAVIIYYVFQELFSSTSPNYVYSKAVDEVISDSRIIHALGSPIKAHGEETAKRRRGHVKNLVYLRNGVEHMKMKFYIQGSYRKADVHLEVRKNSQGHWNYRYLFVELKNRPKSVIVLQDNRDTDNKEYNDSKDSEELMPPNLRDRLIE